MHVKLCERVELFCDYKHISKVHYIYACFDDACDISIFYVIFMFVCCDNILFEMLYV
jgi:hypothetical protein